MQEQDSSGATNLIVTSLPNVRYLTGFTGSSAVLLLSLTDAVIISDGRYVEQLAIQCPGLDAIIRPLGQTMRDVVVETMRSRFRGAFLFEMDTIGHALATFLIEKLDQPLVPSHQLVESVRAIKDETEIETIRQSIAINQEVFEEVCQWVEPDTTERDVAAEIEYRARRKGADGCSFEPIVAVGANAALAHYRPGNRKLNESPFTLIDWGVNFQGYASDLTRIFVGGTVPDRYREIYDITLTAQKAAIEAVKPGVAAKDVDAVARGVIEAAGFGDQFSHSLGHGIGLEIHESPALSTTSEVVLQPGMVITIEPGIYLAGFGGVRIEDDVLVTETGAEVLSDLPKTLE